MLVNLNSKDFVKNVELCKVQRKYNFKSISLKKVS